MTTVASPSSGTNTVRFADGSAIDLRPIGVRDGRLLSSFLTQLSPESEYRRFLSAGRSTRSQWVAGLINADQETSLVHGAFAVNRFGPSLVAVGESIAHPSDPTRAEFALAAVDPWQGMGVGTLLARHLADVARSHGVRLWETHMLADNRQIARVLGRVGRRVELVIESGLSSAVYDLDATTYAF